MKSAPYTCSYLPAETATLDYRLIAAIDAKTYEQLLARGWRRFGYQFFRPGCHACIKCRSLRILVKQFQPSTSHRRNLRRNSHIELVVRRPNVTADHLNLYNDYHRDMQVRRGWKFQSMTEAYYRRTYLEGPGDFAREFLYFDHGKLVGVGLADLLPTSLSSVYFFHDPARRADALGVLSVLRQIEFAQNNDLQHQYLGYWINECGSMAYKSQYRPHEILQRYPADDEQPIWM